VMHKTDATAAGVSGPHRISVDVFAIFYRYRYGFASDNALLTTQYPRLVIQITDVG
jgi:hypothetical protein